MKTHIALVLDRSGSMWPLRRQAMDMYNGLAAEAFGKAKEHGQEASISLVTFANVAKLVCLNNDAASFRPLEERDYQPDGSTALFDGVGEAIESLGKVPDANRPDTAFLVIVITDGEENNSRRFTAAQVVKLLKDTQATDRWSFAFQLPPGQAETFARTWGIPRDNIREWEVTTKGLKETEEKTSGGLASYFTARSHGKTSTRSFYVQTDLSSLTQQQVEAKLTDISGRFKALTVDKESPIREFVGGKLCKPYVIGSAFYELTKREKIQPSKDVLIQKRGGTAIYGGAEARRMLGLPDGVDAKVDPGVHGAWRVYVKSSSVNRVLVRGTTVLVDMTKAKPDVPTWDHEAAEKKAQIAQ